MAGICNCVSEDDLGIEEDKNMEENQNMEDEKTEVEKTEDEKTAETKTEAGVNKDAESAMPSQAEAVPAAAAAASELAFIPQKRSFWNPLLPYKMDEESNRWLAQIKSGLGRAILLQELRPALSWEIESLNKFLKTYLKKFSKVDHILFVKTFYQILNQTDLEASLSAQVIDMLCSLLDEPRLLSPEVLELSWKSLYSTVERIAYNKFQEDNQWRGGAGELTKRIWRLVPLARPYFPLGATKEMLEEWRPMMCPFDGNQFTKVLKYLYNFLPTKLPPSAHESGFKLWFPEFMDIWMNSPGGSIYCGHTIEAYLNSLFCRLAEDNIGYVDWEPYLPEIMNRFFRSLQLPQIPASSGHYGVLTMSKWFVSMMSPTSNIYHHLQFFFSVTDSFFHPSNHGKWTVALLQFTKNLTDHLNSRLWHERHEKPSWMPQIPDAWKLRPVDISRMTDFLLPVTWKAMYSKAGSGHAAMMQRNLAFLRPEAVIPCLFKKVLEELVNLTEPHRLFATMDSATKVANAILHEPELCLKDRSIFLESLKLALPGIDLNDPPKTKATLNFFSAILPLVEPSKKSLSELDKVMTNFIERILEIVENAVDLESVVILDSGFFSLIFRKFPTIFVEIRKQILDYVTSTFLDAETAKVPCHLTSFLVQTICEADAENGFSIFMPKLCQKVVTLTSDPDIVKQETIDDELFWNLNILSSLVSSSGPMILPYMDKLKLVIKQTLTLSAKKLTSIGCELINQVLRSLTNSKARMANTKATHILVDFSDVVDRDARLAPLLTWCQPDATCIAHAQDIFDDVILPVVEELVQITASGLTTLTKEEMQTKLLTILEAIDGAAEALPMAECEASTVVRPIDSILPSFTMFQKITSTEKKEIFFVDTKGDKKNLRCHVGGVLHHFLNAFLLKHRADEVKTTNLVCDIYDALLLNNGKSESEHEENNHMYNAAISLALHPITRKWLFSSEALCMRVNLCHGARLVHDVRLPLTPLVQEVFKDLICLSRSHYESICHRAQNALKKSIGTGFSFSWMLCMDDILEPLTNQWTPEQTRSDPEGKIFRGALTTIARTGLYAKQYWDTCRQTWLTLVRCSHPVASEDPKVQHLVDGIFVTIHIMAETLNLGSRFDETCLDLAQNIWGPTPSAPLPDLPQPTPEEIQNAEQSKKHRDETNHKIYEEMVSDFVASSCDENLRWKARREAMNLLTILFRKDKQINEDVNKMALDFIIHPDVEVRDWATMALTTVLLQTHKKHPKIEVDLHKVTGLEELSDGRKKERDIQEIKWCILNEHTPEISSADEWNQVVFLDRSYLGYYVWPQTVSGFQYGVGVAAPSADDVRRNHIGDFFKNTFKLKQLIEYMSLEVGDPSKGSLNDDQILLWKMTAKVLGPDLILAQDQLSVQVDALKQKKDHSSQRCLAEMVTGFICGSKHWSFEDQRKLWKWISPILIHGIENILVETKTDWVTSMIMITRNRDPRRMLWLLNLLMDHLISSGSANSFRDSNYLAALHGTVVGFSWKIPFVLKTILNRVLPYINHPYKDMRHPTANILAHLFSYQWATTAPPKMDFPHLKSFLKPVIRELEVLNLNTAPKSEVGGDDVTSAMLRRAGASEATLALSDDRSTVTEAGVLVDFLVDFPKDTEFRGAEEIIADQDKEVGLDGETALTRRRSTRSSHYIHQQATSVLRLALAGASETMTSLFGTVRRGSSMYETRGTEAYKEATTKCKTTLAFMARFAAISLGGLGEDFIPLFPSLCSLSGDENNDEDLKVLVRNARRSLLAAKYEPAGLNKMMKALESGAAEGLWHSRLVIARSIPVFVTANLFLLFDKQEFLKGIRDLVLKLLIDERLDVRQEACKTLSGLFHFGLLAATTTLVRDLNKLARIGTANEEKSAATSLGGSQKTTKTKSLSEARLHKCHGGILGLCAIVLAYPYDVPSFIPEVLMELSRHVHDANPIKASVMNAFSEFRRTHVDNWAEDQKSFTEEQNRALIDVLVSPSYYV